MAHILVVGSLNMDLVVHMPAIPRPGETLLGGVFRTFPGGKGANQAVAAARLGAKVSMIGCVGADSFGQQLRQLIIDEGIDASGIITDPHTATGVALITVDRQGQNSIAIASGANFSLTAADVANAWKTLPPVDWLVMPQETPPETVSMAAMLAKQSGAGVILNPAPARELPAELVKQVDVFVPNQTEAEFYTGIAIASLDDARQAATLLMDLGMKSVILTLGAQGAMVIEQSDGQKTATHVPALAVTVQDTTAAGDAFVGALAAALGEGRSLMDAARFASAAAALSVTRAGAQPSLPTRQEVNDFLLSRAAQSE